ncbi:MAG: hypothetical protein FJ197_03790 [Gammaproteobacteria bacterium]|nr:hypothetical protein [Gammaproteobacteria bacterium]
MNTKHLLKAGVVALAVTMAAGCASTTQIEELSAKVDQLSRDVAAAKSAADAANASAADAAQKAGSAQSTANQALNAANQSQACCDATNEKIDRMFKRSQAK